MPKFPEPPDVAKLQQVKPDIKVLRSGTVLWRVHRSLSDPSLLTALRNVATDLGYLLI